MNAERLLKLADHLERGKLGHERFDFGAFNTFDDNRDVYESSDLPLNVCGTAGCALGECPIIWPEDWKFSAAGFPILVDDLFSSPFHSARRWFDISSIDVDALFAPYAQAGVLGLPYLDSHATAAQVAANIRTFVALKQGELQPV